MCFSGSHQNVAVQDLWLGAEQPSDTWTCDASPPPGQGQTWPPSPSSTPYPTQFPTSTGSRTRYPTPSPSFIGGTIRPTPYPTPFPTGNGGPPAEPPPGRPIHPCVIVPGGCPWYTGDACVQTGYNDNLVMPMTRYGYMTGVFHEADTSCSSPGCGSASFTGFVITGRLWLRVVASDLGHRTIFIKPVNSTTTYRVDLPTCDQVVGAGNACGPYWVREAIPT